MDQVFVIQSQVKKLLLLLLIQIQHPLIQIQHQLIQILVTKKKMITTGKNTIRVKELPKKINLTIFLVLWGNLILT